MYSPPDKQYVSTRVLPSTSMEHYITSLSALNIPAPEGTGDWHFFQCFLGSPDSTPTLFVAGVNHKETTPWLSNTGIFNCQPRLKEYMMILSDDPIYAADHYRAVVDMIYDGVIQRHSINGAIILDDWFCQPQEIERIFALLDQLKPAFNEEQWKTIRQWKTKNSG